VISFHIQRTNHKVVTQFFTLTGVRLSDENNDQIFFTVNRLLGHHIYINIYIYIYNVSGIRIFKPRTAIQYIYIYIYLFIYTSLSLTLFLQRKPFSYVCVCLCTFVYVCRDIILYVYKILHVYIILYVYNIKLYLCTHIHTYRDKHTNEKVYACLKMCQG